MDSSSNRAVASAKAGRLISAKGELTTDYVDRMDSQGATAGHAQSASNCRGSAAADASQEPIRVIRAIRGVCKNSQTSRVRDPKILRSTPVNGQK